MSISQERELEIERELAAIMRELDRLTSAEKPKSNKSQQAVQLPWATPLVLDE